MENKQNIIWGVSSLLWLGLMFFLSHQSGDDTFNTSHGFTQWLAALLGVETNWLHGIVRKAAHLILYMVLAFLLCGWQRQRKGRLWVALLVAVVFSFVDEGTKPLIPGRHCDVEDIALNDVGAVIGYVIATWGCKMIHVKNY